MSATAQTRSSQTIAFLVARCKRKGVPHFFRIAPGSASRQEDPLPLLTTIIAGHAAQKTRAHKVRLGLRVGRLNIRAFRGVHIAPPRVRITLPLVGATVVPVICARERESR